MSYRQRAYDLAQRLDKGEATPADAARFLRGEIVIGPRAADVLLAVLQDEKPTPTRLAEARAEVGDFEDLIPF